MVGSHIIPRYYLEGFARKRKPSAKTGHLWVYEKDRPARQGTAKSESVENGYFDFPRAGTGTERSLEQDLAAIENQCNPLLQVAANPYFVWRERNRARMARYCALIHARARAGRYASGFTSTKSLEALRGLSDDRDLLQDLVKHYGRRFGTSLTQEKMKEIILYAADSLSTAEETQEGFLRYVLENTQWTSAILLRKHWQIWLAPEETEFITSDNPVITVLPINGSLAPGFGFGKPGVVVVFPLCPTHCLIMGDFPDFPHRRVEPHVVVKINQSLACYATRHVYSRDWCAGTEEIVRKHGFYIKPGENAFLIPGDWRPILRQFLNHYFGLGD